jgi:hypothetical protein
MAEIRGLEIRGIRRGFKRGMCPICLGNENTKHILLKCSKTNKWKEEFVCSKWLGVNEVIVHKEIIRCKSATKFKRNGKYLF